MAGELILTAAPGTTVVVQVWSAGQVWNRATAAFEALVDADWAAYGIPCVQQGSSTLYLGDFPTAITAPGRYTQIAYAVGDGSPLGDTLIGGPSPIDWRGPPPSAIAAVPGDAMGLTPAALAEITAIVAAEPEGSGGSGGGGTGVGGLDPLEALTLQGMGHSGTAGGAGYGSYPTAADLTAFLEDAGITPSGARLDAAILTGIDRVEQRCMRHFLAGKNIDNSAQPAYARPYDPPTRVAAGDWGALLELGPKGDLARLDSVIYAPQSSNPETFTEGQQFRTLPRGAIARGRPMESMEFRRLWWAPTPQMTWNAIEITGLWGFSTAIPASVWSAMLAAAARSLFAGQFRSAAVPLGLKSWTGPGGISKTYDYSSLTARLADWDMAVQEAVNLYGRWGFG